MFAFGKFQGQSRQNTLPSWKLNSSRSIKTLNAFSHIDTIIVSISLSINWIPVSFFFFLTREAQEFVEKYEGALGKGKGKRLYAYKMLMAKVCGTEAAKFWIWVIMIGTSQPHHLCPAPPESWTQGPAYHVVSSRNGNQLYPVNFSTPMCEGFYIFDACFLSREELNSWN